MAPPYSSRHAPTFATKAERPMSLREEPSAASWRSTIIWVAMPAWSVPGTQRAVSPRMRCQRVRMSISAWLSMWPMWRRPVTLGGGRRMVNFGVGEWVSPEVFSGEGMSKRCSRTQYSAQRCSMTDGSYAFGSSLLVGSWLMGALRVASEGWLRGSLADSLSSERLEFVRRGCRRTLIPTRFSMGRLLLAVAVFFAV